MSVFSPEDRGATSAEAFGQPETPITDLTPGTDGHERLRRYLMSRVELSLRHMTSRYQDWDDVNDAMQMYVDLTKSAKKGDKNFDSTKREMPFDRSLMIPVTYAIHSVRRAVMYSLFASRIPSLRVMAPNPDHIESARSMETVLDYDMRRTKYNQVIYSMIGDADRYGIGVVYDYFDSEYGDVESPNDPSFMDKLLGRDPGTSVTRGIVTQYNKWSNVDPYCYLPDPRVPLARLQESEYQGHRVFRPYTYLKDQEMPNGPYFNIDKIPKLSGASLTRTNFARGRFSPSDFVLGERADSKDRGYYAIDTLQCKIIPSEWGLSPTTTPEIWWFSIANEATIIRCHKSPYGHGKYTYSVAQVEPDPHTVTTLGMCEMLDGIQRIINWFYNSHIENVRKAINDALILSPALIEMQDLLNPKPARHVRLTPTGERMLQSGMLKIPDMYSQLNIQDFTGPHLNIVSGLFDLANRMSSVNDPAMGQPTEPERTLGEVQLMSKSAGQRLAVVASLMDTMAVSDLAHRAIANRKQFTTLEQYYNIIGKVGQGSEFITQSDLQGDYEYVPHSALQPDDPRMAADTLTDIMTQAGQVPTLFQPGPDGTYLDPRKIFIEIAKNRGVRDIDSFMSQMPPPQLPPGAPGGPPQVVPDQQVQQMVQAGNAVPVPQQ